MARELRKMGEERALVLYKVHLKLNNFCFQLFSVVAVVASYFQLFSEPRLVVLLQFSLFSSLANLVAEHAACAVACTLSFCSRFESPESTAPVSSRWSAMSVKPIREHAGKALLEKLLPEISGGKHKMGHAGVLVTPSVLDSTSNGSWDKILEQNPWLKTTNLVAKPDQLIKRRGKAGLIAVNKTFDEAKQWVMDRMCKEQKVEHVTGQLTHFLVEPFVPHKQEQEHYICMLSHRYHDEILFYHEGGVDVGDVDAKAERLEIPTGEALTEATVTQKLLTKLTPAKQGNMASFICSLYKFYTDLHFAYLEINPLVMLDDNTVVPLDMAAKLDETANFLTAQKWGELDWPPPFGRAAYPEEALIRDMDGRTGASLKLTILNEKGRVWTMVAGGGASVVYADTVADYGMGHELANYGEYSGAPSTEETFVYAKTLLSLMMKYKHPEGKFLIIGGGIANFTDVAATFTGLIKALQEYADDIKASSGILQKPMRFGMVSEN